MATQTSFGNMLNQKTDGTKVKKEEASSSKPKNLKELRQMAKSKKAKTKVKAKK